MTLKTPDLTVNAGSALKYKGDLALQKLSADVYLAQFLNFTVLKFDKAVGDVTHPFFVPLEDSTFTDQPVDYYSYVQYPVKFYLKDGQVGDIRTNSNAEAITR